MNTNHEPSIAEIDVRIKPITATKRRGHMVDMIWIPVFSPDGKQIAFSTISDDTAWEIWVINVDGTNPHKVQGAVGNDRNNSANIVDWKKAKFLIGGWEGNWEPYYIPETGGPPQKLLSGSKDDKPSDWWTP